MTPDDHRPAPPVWRRRDARELTVGRMTQAAANQLEAAILLGDRDLVSAWSSVVAELRKGDDAMNALHTPGWGGRESQR